MQRHKSFDLEGLAKIIKVITLRDRWYGDYLTASDDKVSINLSRPGLDGWNPKNTEWTLEWLDGSLHRECFMVVGQVRLWSIYDKVLSFDGDPVYYADDAAKALSQMASTPDRQSQSASEWKFVLNRRENNTLSADISKGSVKDKKIWALFVDNKTELLKFARIYMIDWTVEVVEVATEQQRRSSNDAGTKQQLTRHNYQQKDYYDHKNKSSVVIPASSSPRFQDRVADQFGMRSTLSRWQVGQVNFNVFPVPIAGPATNYLNFYNSGGNFNDSGLQKNGDFMVSDEIHREVEVETAIEYL